MEILKAEIGQIAVARGNPRVQIQKTVEKARNSIEQAAAGVNDE